MEVFNTLACLEFDKEYIAKAPYLIMIPNTGLFFCCFTISCVFLRAYSTESCDLSLKSAVRHRKIIIDMCRMRLSFFADFS